MNQRMKLFYQGSRVASGTSTDELERCKHVEGVARKRGENSRECVCVSEGGRRGKEGIRGGRLESLKAVRRAEDKITEANDGRRTHQQCVQLQGLDGRVGMPGSERDWPSPKARARVLADIGAPLDLALELALRRGVFHDVL